MTKPIRTTKWLIRYFNREKLKPSKCNSKSLIPYIGMNIETIFWLILESKDELKKRNTMYSLRSMLLDWFSKNY